MSAGAEEPLFVFPQPSPAELKSWPPHVRQYKKSFTLPPRSTTSTRCAPTSATPTPPSRPTSSRARQRLLLGDDTVWFLTGTDEHRPRKSSAPRAAAAGIPAPQTCSPTGAPASFGALWERTQASPTTITSEPLIPHHKVRGVQKLFNQQLPKRRRHPPCASYIFG